MLDEPKNQQEESGISGESGITESIWEWFNRQFHCAENNSAGQVVQRTATSGHAECQGQEVEWYTSTDVANE